MSLSEALRTWLLQPVTDSLNALERQIAMSTADTTARLNKIDATLERVAAESSALVGEVATLREKLVELGHDDPALLEVVERIEGRVIAIDDLVPNAAAPAPAPAPTGGTDTEDSAVR
jgi:hypothetical protein